MARYFASGANRNDDEGKLDFEGFLHPLVIEKFGEYMNKHRNLEDGTLRDSDNWQKGIPKDACMKSGWRHFHDWWLEHRGYASREGLDDAICGLIFNLQSYYLSVLKEREVEDMAVEVGDPATDQQVFDLAAQNAYSEVSPMDASRHAQLSQQGNEALEALQKGAQVSGPTWPSWVPWQKKS